MICTQFVIFSITFLIAFWLRNRQIRLQAREVDEALAQQHGCLPPPLLENQYPLGVDRLKQIFRADVENRLMELFLFHIRQTGNTLRQIFLLTPAYGTIDSANLEAILSTNFKDWSIGPRRAIMLPLFGDGIFTQEGQAWKHSRQILRPQFYQKQYEDLTVFDEAVSDLLQAIERNKDNRGIIDLQPFFFSFTLDTTTAFLFGESAKSQSASLSSNEQTFANDFNLAQEYVVKRFRLNKLYWFIGGRRFREACDRVNKFADNIIDRNLSRDRTAKGHERYIFLDSVAEKMDRIALRGPIVNILAAGRDTTASLLSWTLYPTVLEKLIKEIVSITGPTESKPLTRETLVNMKYLQNVLKETLRLYPPLPFNTRFSIRTTVLPTGGGPDRTSPVLIPKGTTVAYSVYSLHRRPDVYGMDAEIFRPERWDENLPLYQNPTDAKWGYLPFNVDFAITEAAYAIVLILQQYPQLALPAGEKIELTGVEKQKMTLVVSIAEGCRVKLSKS